MGKKWKEILLKGVQQGLRALFSHKHSERTEQLLDTIWNQYKRLIENVEQFQEEVVSLRRELCTLNRQLLEAEKLRCTEVNCQHRRADGGGTV